ncbi:MAG TPA: hypothetical protein DEA55_07120 [Rhodospirillaceae bacterium]|nr:hypothetical protein [Rhodospirillaceae bacterium]
MTGTQPNGNGKPSAKKPENHFFMFKVDEAEKVARPVDLGRDYGARSGVRFVAQGYNIGHSKDYPLPGVSIEFTDDAAKMYEKIQHTTAVRTMLHEKGLSLAAPLFSLDRSLDRETGQSKVTLAALFDPAAKQNEAGVVAQESQPVAEVQSTYVAPRAAEHGAPELVATA